MFKITTSSLYRADFEHDACGVGYIANINGIASHEIIENAMKGLKNLAHRGAVDADKITGDGAGILTHIPYKIFTQFLQSEGKNLAEHKDLAVGTVFLSRRNNNDFEEGKKIIEESIGHYGVTLLAWREVPVNPSCLAKKAEDNRPNILQVLMKRPSGVNDQNYERKLFMIMKSAEKKAEKIFLKDFYIVSFSHRSITYKGLLNAPQVKRFFKDLSNPNYESCFALFHQRFATNTFPDWTKAQPYRMMAHNGEINTIRGNRNQMRARECSTDTEFFGDDHTILTPFLQPNQSDSASFDNSIQLMNVGGRNLSQILTMMMPFAWENDSNISEQLRSFYRHHACIMEPWDGPAAIVAFDGRYIVSSLDRNGLRPARYKIYEDGTIVLGSEAGLIDIDELTVESGRLGPGRMMVVDLQEHRVFGDHEIKSSLSEKANYPQWCKQHLVDLNKISRWELSEDYSVPEENLKAFRSVFNYDKEELELILTPMIETGKEAVGSMGDDTPLAVLSHRPRLLYSYFKQLFAQVTNPAIDPIRENMVMSLHMYLGGRLSLFEDISTDRNFLEIRSPLLLKEEFDKVGNPQIDAGERRVIDATFNVNDGSRAMECAIKDIRTIARQHASNPSVRFLIISDRNISAGRAPIPMLLSIGAIQQTLINTGLRSRVDLIAETGEARDTHQIACLLGYGANAVFPYLAIDLVHYIHSSDKTEDKISLSKAYDNYRNSINNGLLKIFAKMGISTLWSYQGCQLFEAIGISNNVVEECFTGTNSPIDGIGYSLIAQETIQRHQRTYKEELSDDLWSEGYYHPLKKGQGEIHGWSPKVVSGMNRLIRKSDFQPYKTASEDHAPIAVKDLLSFRYEKPDIPLENVEPIEDIRARFTTAAMSLGAISPEAHESLAIAMNAIGGKSNSGEGGEDPKRYQPYEDGDDANSAIKQVASGRFGVTAEYLSNAKEIEIKVSQGAKPGEGGQLPGHKVTPLIAMLRFSVPGVTLISPPPHHDIYSIEDLSQLIFDLKEVNPRAKVCVKLVSSSGIGTIAAGVAKAYADVILVSGHDGGTGASPVSSIKNAGSSWEIGIAEVHQTLMINDLRNAVTLRTDGGFKTGSDVVKAAMLGAEQFNFGTGALIAVGCAMFRICHKNTCPVGVATQREDLRKKFRGKPDNVINYFNSIAEDVRRILAKLGFRKLDDIIGRTELLQQIDDAENPKSKSVNLSKLLHNVDPNGEKERIHTKDGNDSPEHEHSIDHRIIQDAKNTLVKKTPVFRATYKVRNTHRDIGTRLAGEIAFHHGNTGMPHSSLDLTFLGSSGQSFGVFTIKGMRLRLIGEANDYVGKGMNGGEIIIRPEEKQPFVWSENTLLGNTCLYGATGGFLFAAGCAGERFAVRNSGATAVVEGIGDHGCEYMNAGTVICLGKTGRNFGSGMSGGMAFILDELDNFSSLYNREMVGINRLDHPHEIDNLRSLIESHYQFSQSPRAEEILMDWDHFLKKFWKVCPHQNENAVSSPVFQIKPEEQEALVV